MCRNTHPLFLLFMPNSKVRMTINQKHIKRLKITSLELFQKPLHLFQKVQEKFDKTL